MQHPGWFFTRRSEHRVMISPPPANWSPQLACCCADQDCASDGAKVDLCRGSLFGAHFYGILNPRAQGLSTLNEVVYGARATCIRPIACPIRRDPEPALHAGAQPEQPLYLAKLLVHQQLSDQFLARNSSDWQPMLRRVLARRPVPVRLPDRGLRVAADLRANYSGRACFRN